ncbi:MAG: hypothetical protein U1E49_01620 [Hyphomicrobiaceae bacterium]
MRFGIVRLRLLDRIADDLGDGELVVGQAIDERRVGAVLEQTADEIGEQILVLADGGIDAGRRGRA